jgi:hypothetical protein
MYVQKRNGKSERVQFDKISSRIQKLAYGLNQDFVDPAFITQKVIKGVYAGVTTVQLDTLAAETAAYLTTEHPDYSILAARIAVSNLHKQTEKCFSTVMHDLYNCVDASSGRHAPLLSDSTYQTIMKHKEELDSAIIYDRDYSYDFFGFKTLERSYLLKINGKIAERPQHMLMRVSVGIHGGDIPAAIETYNYMSQKFFTHARCEPRSPPGVAKSALPAARSPLARSLARSLAQTASCVAAGSCASAGCLAERVAWGSESDLCCGVVSCCAARPSSTRARRTRRCPRASWCS